MKQWKPCRNRMRISCDAAGRLATAHDAGAAVLGAGSGTAIRGRVRRINGRFVPWARPITPGRFGLAPRSGSAPKVGCPDLRTLITG